MSEHPFLDDPEILAEFLAEAREHLGSVEENLLRYEREPDSDDFAGALFRPFHSIKGNASLLGLSKIAELAQETESVLERVRSGELRIGPEITDIIFQATDEHLRLLEVLEDSLGRGVEPPADPKTAAVIEGLRRVESAIELDYQASEGLALDSSSAIDDIPVGDLPSVKTRESRARELIRVPPQRIDELLNLVGEMVIDISVASRCSREGDAHGARERLVELEKSSRMVHELTASLRLVPIRKTLQKMERLVRSLARGAGKQVILECTGGDCELDRAIVEEINDPLVHILRNAVDHGLEERAEDRVAQGKPECGRIELRAFHRGSSFILEIEDDGRGLDREKLLRVGHERGLFAAGDSPGEAEIYRVIFEPGLSTADRVTDISGRGVGMDVVKRNIDRLRGEIDIESVPGKGCCIRIRLPLTVATIDGMVVRVGTQFYIVPTAAIARTVPCETRRTAAAGGSENLICVDDEILPLERLAGLFEQPGDDEPSENEVAVLLESAGDTLALAVDEIVGQQETVIKSLEGALGRLPGITGAAVLSAGDIAWILDVAGVFELFRESLRAGV